MDQFIPIFGAYFWWILAGLLLIAEMMAPGFFMMWLAAAAAITAAIHMVLHTALTTEVMIFAILSAVLVAATWRFVTKMWHTKSDQPHLNQRHAALIGKSFVLTQPIVNGQGKIRYEDTLWDVDGPDLSAGARVKVTGVDGLRLRVKEA